MRSIPPMAFTIGYMISVVVLMAIVGAFAIYTDYYDADETVIHILRNDLPDCSDPQFDNKTNVGDFYYCRLQNHSAYCKVDAHADPHLEGVAFCKPVVLH